MPFSGMGAATCVWKLQGRVNNGKVALDALELARSGREMRKGGESGCPERKIGSLPPLIIDPWDPSMKEVEEEHMRLCEKVELMEISGNGQNMHFKFLPEGV